MAARLSWLGASLGAALALSFSLLAARAHSEPGAAPAPSQLAAEAAFADGVRLMKAARCEEAVAKFTESDRLEPASGTLLNLAYCELQIGRVASAWIAYRRAIPLAARTGKPLHERIAREQADKLERDLPRLTVVVLGGAERSLTVMLDTLPLAHETWSVPVPVDPGPHRLSAVLEDGRHWESDVMLSRSQQARIEVPTASQTPPRKPRQHADRLGSQRSRPPLPAHVERPLWALGVSAVGAAAVLAGSALFVSARVQYDSPVAGCPETNLCDAEGKRTKAAIAHRAQLGGVLAGSGALVAGAGAIAYFVFGKTSPGAVAWIGVAEPWSAGIEGRF